MRNITSTAATMAALALVLGSACSGDETEQQVADDGKYHPPPNGVHITEDEACTQLQTSFQQRVLALQCSKTVRTCPELLRYQFDPDCMEYDQGSVDGCEKYYAEIESCDDLVDTDCVVTPYPGTEPAGCP